MLGGHAPASPLVPSLTMAWIIDVNSLVENHEKNLLSLVGPRLDNISGTIHRVEIFFNLNEAKERIRNCPYS
jgi:hypothetical protein